MVKRHKMNCNAMTQPLQRGTEGKKICIFYLHFRPHENPILGHQHCGSEWRSQRSFLQLMTYDVGKICENAP